MRQQIDLGGKDALVELEVKTGHRDTPVVAAQIEKAELKRIEAARSVLAQESTGGNAGSRTGMTFNEFWMRQQQALLAANNRAFPFGGGAVGYQPNIQNISEGGSMSTTAVISGDRRYVRITPFPFFSQIIQVDTFNFVNGTGTTQPGGLGGGVGGAAGGFGGGGFGGGGIQ